MGGTQGRDGWWHMHRERRDRKGRKERKRKESKGYLWVAIIKFRLLLDKLMKIILLSVLIPFPR